jgi:replicative DNA helicase
MPAQSPSSTDNAIQSVKVLPHSIEAEQSVIGGLMLDNNAWDKVSELLSESDFHRTEHQIIFKTLQNLSRRNQPFDVITVSDELKNQNKINSIGGEVYLFELTRNTPTASNIAAYAEIVRERSIRRKLIESAGNIANLAFNPDGREIKEIVDSAEREIFTIAEQRSRGQGPVDISAILAQASDKIDDLYHSDKTVTGIATGFLDLDEITSGLHKGELTIIAGRPSMGKTSFAMNIAENVSIKNTKPVLVFSLEMPNESLAMRMISSLGRIDQKKVRTGKLTDDDWPRLNQAIDFLSETPLFIDDTPSLSPAELRARARRLAKSKGELGLIIVDYLQLMQIPGIRAENRVAEISEISRSMKSLAKEMNVPVIALSQLNRGLEQRQDKRPLMSDLRESGAIEQDADVILFVYRDEVYNENTTNKGIAEIIIAKHRNGPIGKISLTFLGQYTKFENYLAQQFTLNDKQ